MRIKKVSDIYKTPDTFFAKKDIIAILGKTP